MKITFTSALAILSLTAIASPGFANEVVWSCPDGELTRRAIISGEAETWPYFTPGPGMRVQKQHSKTALMGQAKYIEGNGKTGAVCQYYNHVGFVFTIIAIGAKKHVTSDGSYWRKEYTESFAEKDDPSNPMTDVCMMTETETDTEKMSIGCPFLITLN